MDIKPEISAALIAAITSTIITPVIQALVSLYKQNNAYKSRIAPVIENIRILQEQLLQIPINNNIEGISERIAIIEQFHDALFNSYLKHSIKTEYIKHAKHLAKRHQSPRPWMQIEFPEEVQIFNNHTDRLIAVLNKKSIPDQFDPSE